MGSYYRLIKTIEDDPEFDTKRTQKKLRRYVEAHEHAIRQKAEIMMDHFHDQVLARQKVGGKARAMVVTGSIERAMQYKVAFDAYLAERKSPYRAIVAFSGEHEFGGEAHVDEAKLNGFPSSTIPDKFRQDPYRFLIVAEKFQTGYDEPLLHTMYVDKVLSGIKAVQTLSRLNRAHPRKHDIFILDFVNDADTIETAFADYYRTTMLSQETDPNKLHDLKADLDGYQVYHCHKSSSWSGCTCAAPTGIGWTRSSTPAWRPTTRSWTRTGRWSSRARPRCSSARTAFWRPSCRTRCGNGNAWRRSSISLSRNCRRRRKTTCRRAFWKPSIWTVTGSKYRRNWRSPYPTRTPTLEPVPLGGRGGKPEAELDRLSNILRTFNDQFGNIEWKDADKIRRVISEEIPAKVSADTAYQNAKKHSDKQNARIEHDNALRRIMIEILADNTELYKQFSDNESFRKWLADTVFSLTYEEGSGGHEIPQ